MSDFVLICGLPRSGTREITDIFNNISEVCVQGEITGANFKHSCEFVRNIVTSSEGLNRERIVRKGAGLFSDALGLAGKAPLNKSKGAPELVGFKCPNAQSWYKEILEIANVLNFRVHIVFCLREPQEVYRSLTQMDWYNGGYDRFEKMCTRLIKTFNEITQCTDPLLGSVQVFNLNQYIISDAPAEYIGKILAKCNVDCSGDEVDKAIGSVKNRNATARKKSKKEINFEDMQKNEPGLSRLAKKLAVIQ